MSRVPAARQPVVEKGPAGLPLFTRPWFLFFQDLGRSDADPVTIAVGASPFSYTATVSGVVIISGGAVSLIEYGRNGIYTDTGAISGVISVVEGDVIRVTHAGAPVMTVVQR